MQPVYSDAQIVSAIKRLNDRIKQFYKQGLTDSQQFYTLLGQPETLANGIIQQGVFTNYPMAKARKAREYPQLIASASAYTPEQQRQIMKFGKIGSQTTAGQAKAGAIRVLKEKGIENPTKDQIKIQARRNKETHDFIVRNADDIYKVQELANAVWKSEKLTADEQDRLLNMYENPDYLDDDGDFVGDSNNTSYVKQGTPT